MFFLVRLDSGEKKVIPSKWIKEFPTFFVQMLNYGIQTMNKFPINIFYSNDIGAEPDFTLKTQTAFDQTHDACYEAKIINNFGEYQLFLNKTL